MKALLGLVIVAAAGMTTTTISEPAIMLVSGGLLLGLAGAVRRLPV
ncbi:MAG: hypothetical protein WEB50_00720 [Vicinamibacterales bacterium]